MKAVIIGATGSTGGFLVDELLSDKDYSLVTIFVRKPTGKKHRKLIEHIIDFSCIEKYRKLISGDVMFSCLGTTLKEAGSRDQQWKVDCGIPLRFANLARANGMYSFVLLSSFDASVKSLNFKSFIRGETEIGISKFNYEQYIIFKAGPLLRSGTDRWNEKIITGALKLFNRIGLFEKFTPLPTAVLAEKLAKAPKLLPGGTSIIRLEHIFKFAANLSS